MIPAVGVLIRDAAGRLLLVQRAHPPQAGTWTVPGGRVEPGETLAQAAAREAFEETGLQVAIGAQCYRIAIPAGDGRVFDVHDFEAEVLAGTPRAGDDAADLAWVDPARLDEFPVSPQLRQFLGDLGLLGGRPG